MDQETTGFIGFIERWQLQNADAFLDKSVSQHFYCVARLIYFSLGIIWVTKRNRKTTTQNWCILCSDTSRSFLVVTYFAHMIHIGTLMLYILFWIRNALILILAGSRDR
jgi:hypothetical protein